MRELKWNELKSADEERAQGEGSLDVSHLLATVQEGRAIARSDESPADEERIPYGEALTTRNRAGYVRTGAEKTRKQKSFSISGRRFFPAVMLILALTLVFLYVMLAGIGRAGHIESAAAFAKGMSPLGFSSLFYVFFFLPAVLLLYYLIPGRYAKPIILLIASLLFYSFAQPIYLAALLLVCFFNYVAGIELSYRGSLARQGKKAGRTVIGILAIAGNLLLPFLFVFLPWARSLAEGQEAVPNLALPLGLMFTALRGIVYLTDIWRGRSEGETDFFLFALYITFFPTIALGPIDHYEKIRPAFAGLFTKKKAATFELFGSGVERFLFGFFKKTLLASPLYVLTLRIRQVPEAENTVFLAWILALSYALWLALELSAYADMAVGTARMLGIRISESFDHPFLSLSVCDFWRRWQITVTGWFRETICRPVYGESGSFFRHALGILLAAGLFAAAHGTSLAFLILAAYMGVLLILDTGAVGRLFRRFPDALRWLFTAILLLIAAAILLGAASTNVFSPVFALFGGAAGGVANATMLYLLRTHLALLIVSAVTASGLFLRIYRWIRKKLPVIAIILLIFIFGLALAAGIGGTGPDTFMRIALGQ